MADSGLYVVVLEVAEPARRDVPEIAGRVHQLVVTVQQHHPPARGLRLTLQPEQQLEDLALAVAAIQHVARLHQHGLAARPAAVGVGQATQPQRRARGPQVTVHVPQGHHALRRRPLPGGRRRQQQQAGQQQGHLAASLR